MMGPTCAMLALVEAPPPPFAPLMLTPAAAWLPVQVYTEAEPPPQDLACRSAIRLLLRLSGVRGCVGAQG